MSRIFLLVGGKIGTMADPATRKVARQGGCAASWQRHQHPASRLARASGSKCWHRRCNHMSLPRAALWASHARATQMPGPRRSACVSAVPDSAEKALSVPKSKRPRPGRGAAATATQPVAGKLGRRAVVSTASRWHRPPGPAGPDATRLAELENQHTLALETVAFHPGRFIPGPPGSELSGPPGSIYLGGGQLGDVHVWVPGRRQPPRHVT